jgi:hypothetical protein
VGFRLLGFFLDRNDLQLLVEFDHPIALRLVDEVTENGRA